MANLWRDMQAYMDQKKTDDISNSIWQLQATPPPKENLGAQLGREAAISFTPPPVVSQVDQDKKKYYSTLVQAGIDPSMARQIAGFVAPAKGSLDKWTGKSAWHPGAGGSSYYPDSIFTDVTGGGSIEGVWNY